MRLIFRFFWFALALKPELVLHLPAAMDFIKSRLSALHQLLHLVVQGLIGLYETLQAHFL